MVLSSKPHYPILDGLRGVAAMMVVGMHVCEANSTSIMDMKINHGYLAVDFFFLLSGFVIGYAYDDRWTKMSIGGFFKRRLERLQPLVILGMIIGAICFYWSDSPTFPNIHNVPLWQVIGIMLIGFTLIPVPTSMDIRGWQEMHPLNGPGWSLFYEYVANILYAVGLRKLSKAALSVLVFLAGAALLYYCVTCKNGDVIGGWSITQEQLTIGFVRLMYPFFAGLLISRTIKPGKINNAFFISALMLVILLSVPRIGGETQRWMNGLYEALTILFLFPVIIYIGASGQTSSKTGTAICKFLGDISYPIYITHYPFIYIYTGYVNSHPRTETTPNILYGALTFIVAVSVGYASLKLYDEPIRAWLKRKWGNA
ncbi:acyltransferase [Chitinophaga sp. Cy-1792]|nr:acyltransferase [Chitinophaga sp. Cy-1792]